MNRHRSNRSSQFFELLEHRDYYKELNDLTKVKIPAEVISSIYVENNAMWTQDPTTFRKYQYIVMDDVTYAKIYEHR